LIEVAIATVIISLALTALMSTLRSGTNVSANSIRMTTATFLAQNIHEWTMYMPFEGVALTTPGASAAEPDFIEDFHGMTFSPPRDGMGSSIASQAGWSQTVHLSWRDSSDLKTPVTGPADAMHVTVEVKYQDNTVTTMQYLLFKKPPAP